MPHPYGLDDTSSRTDPKTATLVDEVVARHAADVDRNARFPVESLAALGAAGLFGLTVPRDLGGLGHGPRAFCAVAEELARGCASTAMIFVMHTSAHAGDRRPRKTLGDRDALLRQIAAGKHLTTLALSEKGSRSQFWAPVSKLVAQRRRLRHQRRQVVGDLGQSRRLVRRRARRSRTRSRRWSRRSISRAPKRTAVRPQRRLRRARPARQRLGAGEHREPDRRARRSR